jgi:hypothetical protein
MISRLMSLLLLSAVWVAEGRTQSVDSDFLPLNVGNQWTYNYLTVSNDLFNESAVGDSGTAIYTVVSKYSSADSTVWGFLEIRDVVHWYRSYHAGIPSYSASPLRDTTSFELVEHSSGHHRLLRNASLGLVWHSVFCLTPEFSDSSTFFRFIELAGSDTLTLTARRDVHYALAVTLKRSVGMTSVKYSTHLTGGSDQSTHTLRLQSVMALNSGAGSLLPADLCLYNSYPNPFNPQTIIPFSIGTREKVTIAIHDVLGRTVCTLFDQVVGPGRHSVIWDASTMASGSYFCVARTSETVRCSRLLLVR